MFQSPKSITFKRFDFWRRESAAKGTVLNGTFSNNFAQLVFQSFCQFSLRSSFWRFSKMPGKLTIRKIPQDMKFCMKNADISGVKGKGGLILYSRTSKVRFGERNLCKTVCTVWFSNASWRMEWYIFYFRARAVLNCQFLGPRQGSRQ